MRQNRPRPPARTVSARGEIDPVLASIYTKTNPNADSPRDNLRELDKSDKLNKSDKLDKSDYLNKSNIMENKLQTKNTLTEKNNFREKKSVVLFIKTG